ncbi:MAG: hypothetical protein ABI462_03360 [Ignavibacteria bacterium]
MKIILALYLYSSYFFPFRNYELNIIIGKIEKIKADKDSENILTAGDERV